MKKPGIDTPETIFLILFVVVLSFLVVTAPDLFWHLKTGEYILARGSLPSADPFSYTRAGSPWILHEWLFEVIWFLIYQKSGVLGIKIVTAALGVLSFYFAYLAAKSVLRQPVLVSLLSMAGLVAASPYIIPRPQLITYLFFSFTLFALFQFKYVGRSSYLWALPPLMVVWANMHGGVFAGITLLVLATACEFLSAWYNGDSARRNQASTLFKITVLAFVCTAINPYFIKLWLYPFQVHSMAATDSIREWLSPNFHTLRCKLYLSLVIGFYVINIYRRSKPDLVEVILPSFFIVASFVSARHMPLATLSMIPFAGVAISRGTVLTGAESRAGRIYSKHLASSRQLGEYERLLNLGLFALVIIFSLIFKPFYEPLVEAKRNAILPVKASDFILKSKLKGNMFNEYHFGGYLIYRLFPQQKVFIDGRVDMYGDEFYRDYGKIIGGRQGWQTAFAKYPIDYVICGKGAPIRQLLLTRGDFRLVYDDDNQSVLVKDVPKYAAIIAKYELPRH